MGLACREKGVVSGQEEAANRDGERSGLVGADTRDLSSWAMMRESAMLVRRQTCCPVKEVESCEAETVGGGREAPKEANAERSSSAQT